mmetsp:Transcript_15009/g.33001  ORF Transcript_15009/g.33001 Transcript_15009/m.33001 type:complete len:324 (-) Transcript_15009:3122-4093(-)
MGHAQTLHLVVFRLVATRPLNSVHGAGHGQLELRIKSSVLACGLNRFLRSPQSGIRQHKRRLANGLGPQDTLGERVVAQQLDVEFPGHLRGHRRLVLPHSLGPLDPVGIKQRLLSHVVANPETERPFDLPDIDARVQALPDVKQNIRPKNTGLTGEHVQFDLRAPGAEGEIVAVVVRSDRVPLNIRGVLVGLWREDPGGRELLRVPQYCVRRGAHLGPGGLGVLPLLGSVLGDLGRLLLAQEGGVGLQGLLEFQARPPGRLAAHFRSDGATGEPHVRDNLRVRVGNPDAVHGSSKGQGHNLGDLGVNTLPDLASTMVNGDGAI